MGSENTNPRPLPALPLPSLYKTVNCNAKLANTRLLSPTLHHHTTIKIKSKFKNVSVTLPGMHMP